MDEPPTASVAGKAVPIHSPTGELLAYAGWSLDGEPGWKFPPKFDRQLELYNLHRAAEEGLVVIADIPDVSRLYDVGYPNAVSLMGDAVSPEQESLLTALAGESRKVWRFLSLGALRDELLKRLSAELYVRVVSAEYGLRCALSDEELEQLLP